MISGGSSDSSPSKDFLEKSNELREASCRALKELYSSYVISRDALSGEVQEKQSLASMPTLAHNISVFLDCLEYGFEMIEVQLAALDAMDALLFQIICSGDNLSLLLPGIVSRIVKLVCGKFGGRCNYRVISSSLDLLSRLLTIVMNDDDLTGILNDDDSVISTSTRTKSWLKATQDQIKLSLDSIIFVRSHAKSEPRSSILALVLNLLSKSSRSLSNCLPTIVDTVVYFASTRGDLVDQELSMKAEECLKTYLSESSDFRQVFEKRSFNWIDSLPRLLSSHDDQQSITILNAIQLSLDLLQESSKSLSSESLLRESLIRTFGDVVNLKPVNKRPLPIAGFTFDSRELVRANAPSASQSQSFFADIGIMSSLSGASQSSIGNLLHSIGSSKHGSTVLNSLLLKVEDEPTDSESKITYFWMAIKILGGLTGNGIKSNGIEDDEINSWIVADDTDAASPSTIIIADSILDIMYFCRDVIQKATSVRFKKESDPVVCLSLEGISLIAKYLGIEFREELVDTLYPLVEMLGHSNPLVLRQAQSAIIEVTRSCEYDTVQSLIVDNADYLVDGMSIKLNTLDISPRTNIILTTLINLAGPSITPYLDDLVSTMFIILDNYHGYTTLTSGIFSVFRALVKETEKGYSERLLLEVKNVNLQSDGTLSEKSPHMSNLGDLLAALSHKPQLPDIDSDDEDDIHRHGNKPFSQRLDEIENRENLEEALKDDDMESKPLDNPEETKDKEWKSLVPKSTYKVVEHIVKYSDRYLTHSSSNIRYNLLELMSTSMTIMASSKEDFLPIVNGIWPVLVSRLNDSDIFILEATLKCIGIICEKAGDFMSTRIISLWPKLNSFLVPTVMSPFALSRAAAKFSPELRLFKALDECLEKIIASTPVPDDLFDSILAKFSRYFTLNDETLGLKKELERVNEDAVWLACLKLSPENIPSAPHESLNAIRLLSV